MEKKKGGKKVEKVSMVGDKGGRKGVSEEKRMGEGGEKEKRPAWHNNTLINLTESE